MTKEDLYELAKGSLEFPDDKVIPTQYLDKFFESNVCITKGKHRHKDAEALHEWVEGAKIEKRPNGGSWCNTAGVNQHFDGSIRIKPSEAIYEYIWYNVDGDTKWMTLDEAKEFERPWFWAKETSRMRQ